MKNDKLHLKKQVVFSLKSPASKEDRPKRVSSSIIYTMTTITH